MRAASTLLAAVAAAGSISAQVVITEVHPAESWIEIQNRGTTARSLDTWTIFCTTDTPSRVQTYWWHFPADTELAAGAFLRVHWFHPEQPSTATDIFTGDDFHDFAFSLGGEVLRTSGGSVGLISTIDGDEMGDPQVYEDWITWGRPNPPRQALAEANGRWVADTFVESPSADVSIALSSDPTPEPTLPSEFFLDATPSPLAPNHAGAMVRSFGTDCAVGVLNAPSLEAIGLPSVGNSEFSFRAHGTYGTHGQTVVFMLGFAEGNGATIPLRELACPLWVGGPAMLTFVAPATFGSSYTDLPFSLAGFGQGAAGLTLYMQAFAAVLPFTEFDHAASAGLAVTLGG